MIVKEATYVPCEKCGRQLTYHEPVYACDCCKKEFGHDEMYDRFNVFHNREDGIADYTEEFLLCSWDCFFKLLPKIKTNYFVSMPMLSYEEKAKGLTVKDFWKAVDAYRLPAKKARRK
jgi:hypothetical protein